MKEYAVNVLFTVEVATFVHADSEDEARTKALELDLKDKLSYIDIEPNDNIHGYDVGIEKEGIINSCFIDDYYG